MKISLSHKVFSTLLSLLVMISTVSFTVESHYCGDVLIDVSVFSEARDCSANSDTKTTMQKPCCKDVIDVLEGQDELSITSFDNLEFDTQLFITTYIYSVSLLFESLPKQVIPHKNYRPPNLIYDIQLLDVVFLI